ncbi:acyclic terpene utilization AtuA family protein [Mycolicibacterium thermoresistibile]
MTDPAPAPLRIANCSGFYGDRLAAAREMIDGGPVDVLTGDWLAELTMGLLLRKQQRDPAGGFASTFLTQLRDVLADCPDRGIKIVSNAGGLDPHACGRGVEQIAAELGQPVKVAVVTGDDATAAVTEALQGGWAAPHVDTGRPFSDLGAELQVASAYLGCWGIVSALAAGADVVITGRVSDASVVVGPAAWHFGWGPEDVDALAGAVVAGHVIECGAQATGGNYAFFTEIDDLSRAGFPIAEIGADGSAVITKHPDTGGAVTVETVTAQLLYEIDGPRYLSPDAVARFDTIELVDVGSDRVQIRGVRGESAPDTVKLGLLSTPGYRNSVTFVLTGTDIEAKAAVAERALWAAVPGGRAAFDEVAVQLLPAADPHGEAVESTISLLRVAVRGPDRNRIAQFSRAAVETGLASYPGCYFTDPPGAGSAYTVFWPTLLPARQFPQTVHLGGSRWQVPPPAPAHPVPAGSAADVVPLPQRPDLPSPSEAVQRVPLGRVVGARSGDKGGNATVGVWARDDAGFAWLSNWLTEQRWRELLPQTADLKLRPWWLPQLRAAGVTVEGYLGHGVAANLQFDAQAKGLGEFLRAQWAEVPARLLAGQTTR